MQCIMRGKLPDHEKITRSREDHQITRRSPGHDRAHNAVHNAEPEHILQCIFNDLTRSQMHAWVVSKDTE
jgi:hypothetical protein